MWHAVAFALMDSINVLLIGVVVALGITSATAGTYRKLAALLVGGDWLGVFLVSIPTLALFDQVQSHVRAFLDSPLFGIILILIGVGGAIATWRGGSSGEWTAKIMAPLRTPSPRTVAIGMLLGAVQSLTSFPFFTGLAYLSTGGFSLATRYTALFLYASLALSLPAACAVAVGFIRQQPRSAAGRVFETARRRQATVAKGAGYLISIALVAMGVTHL